MKNNMYFDTSRARINKDIYRPSSNLIRFVKSLLRIVLSGQSTITSESYMRRRAH